MRLSKRRLIILASSLISLALIVGVLLYWYSEGWAEQKLQDYLKRLEDSGCTTEEHSLTDFHVSNVFRMQFFGDFLSYAKQEDINQIYFDRGMHALYFLHPSNENGVEAVIFYYK